LDIKAPWRRRPGTLVIENGEGQDVANIRAGAWHRGRGTVLRSREEAEQLAEVIGHTTHLLAMCAELESLSGILRLAVKDVGIAGDIRRVDNLLTKNRTILRRIGHEVQEQIEETVGFR
jgi:hypothetical protein